MLVGEVVSFTLSSAAIHRARFGTRYTHRFVTQRVFLGGSTGEELLVHLLRPRAPSGVEWSE